MADPSFPLGYKFMPTPRQILGEYLIPKLRSEQIPVGNNITIPEEDVYAKYPGQLCEDHQDHLNVFAKPTERYFFTLRNRLFPNSYEPSRTARDGRWSSFDETNEEVLHNGEIIGYKLSMYFIDNQNRITDWMMDEFTSAEHMEHGPITDVYKLEHWVACKVYIERDEEESGDESYEDTASEGSISSESSAGSSSASSVDLDGPFPR